MFRLLSKRVLVEHTRGERGGRHQRRRGTALDQLDAQEEADAPASDAQAHRESDEAHLLQCPRFTESSGLPNVTDAAMAMRELREPLEQVRAHCGRVLAEMLALDGVEHRQRSHARDWIASEL